MTGVISRLAKLIGSFAVVTGLHLSAQSDTGVPGVAGGGDISMLPALERHGVVYRDIDGKQADFVQMMRQRGCEYFRVRVFVEPTSDFSKNWGAVQDFAQMRELCRRITAAGGRILLCIHYSDTWADPEHQTKPRSWQGLTGKDLEKQIYDYTTSLLQALATDGSTPDTVQVGNEITAGMLWPDGKIQVKGGSSEQEQSFKNLVALFNAGAKAIRNCSSPPRPIRVALHAHGGGRPVSLWFIRKMAESGADFDVAALSFYPQWNDDIDVLRSNVRSLIDDLGKEVSIVETGYPWRQYAQTEQARATLRWPLTPEGQVLFLRDLEQLIAAAPGGKCGVWYWWYPEARPLDVHQVYMGGAGSLVDSDGKPLPAMELLGK